VSGENLSETTEGAWRGATRSATAQTNRWAQRCRHGRRTGKRIIEVFPATALLISGARDRDAVRT
jgi:hypothetical protein